MQIRIYDPETLQLHRILSGATSIQWVRRFFDAGDFEIHFPPNTKWTDSLKIGCIIGLDDKYGIVAYREETKTDVNVRGYDLNGLARQRMVVPPFVYKETPEVIEGYDRVKGTAEETLRYYVNMHMINPYDTFRKVNGVQLGTLQGWDVEKTIAWQSRFDNLKDVLYDICSYSKLGYRFSFVPEKGCIFFEVLKGVDRSVNQNENPPVIFSRRYKTLNDYTYTDDKLDFLNTVYVGANGEEEEQFVLEVHREEQSKEPQGILRYEGFTEISSEDPEEIEESGLAFLSEHMCDDVVNAEISDTRVYKKDWDVGDIVTIKLVVFGEEILVDKQVTEVREIYEPCNYKIEPVFGEKTKEDL